jgi:hypothetical protein
MEQLSCPTGTASSNPRSTTHARPAGHGRRVILFRLRARREARGARDTLAPCSTSGCRRWPSSACWHCSCRALREFRRASDEFRTTVETNLHINEPDPPPPTSASSDVTTTPLPSETEPLAPETSDVAVAVSEPPEHGEPYCAQRGSRLFHRRECAWVARIPETERVYMKTMAEAREQGLSTCPVCEPWEPV